MSFYIKIHIHFINTILLIFLFMQAKGNAQDLKVSKPALNKIVRSSSSSTVINSTGKLLNFFKVNQGKGILVGQQDMWREGRNRPEPGIISDMGLVTGEEPSLMGLDFREIYHWPNVFWDKYKNWIVQFHNMGGVTTLSWHMDNPVSGKNFFDKTPAVRHILPGGSHHQNYLTRLDKLAKFLKELRDSTGATIPIILRPLHEHNGDWFWWSVTDRACQFLCFIEAFVEAAEAKADEDFINLWRFTVNYLRQRKNVKNILIAYSPGVHRTGKDYLWRYPGDAFVDILGFDKYGPGIGAFKSALLRVMEVARQKNKVAALTETGHESIPNPKYWTEGILKEFKDNSELRKLSYVMFWRNSSNDPKHYFSPFPGHPSAPDFESFYQDPFTLFLGDFNNQKSKFIDGL